MKILIIGASGGVGRALCRLAASRGHDAIAMSRSAVKEAKARPGLTSTRGDALQLEDVRDAIQGVDVVVQALGVPVLQMITKPVTLFSRATAVLLDVMSEVGAKRLISITGFGAGDSVSKIGKLQKLLFKTGVGRAYADKSEQERLIESSDLDWLIVRPGRLTDAPGGDRYRVLTNPNDWHLGVISREDVAHFIMNRIEEKHYGREKVVIIQ